MALKHNKKRNCGLLAEFFARHMAECTVSWKHDSLKSAKELWGKYVQPGTEIQKEMELFKVLYETKLANREIGMDLLKQVRSHAQKINFAALEEEKTELIREVQQKLKNPKFFDAPVEDYTTLATIQILLSSWIEKPILSEGVINPAISELQDQVLTHLLREEKEPKLNPDCLKMTESDINGLVVNIMTEKMNEKFGVVLSENQKDILRQFSFGTDKKFLTKTLESLRENSLGLIDREITTKNLAKPERQKLVEIKKLLEEEYNDVSNPDEACITFYMTVSQLNDELKDEE